MQTMFLTFFLLISRWWFRSNHSSDEILIVSLNNHLSFFIVMRCTIGLLFWFGFGCEELELLRWEIVDLWFYAWESFSVFEILLLSVALLGQAVRCYYIPHYLLYLIKHYITHISLSSQLEQQRRSCSWHIQRIYQRVRILRWTFSFY